MRRKLVPTLQRGNALRDAPRRVLPKLWGILQLNENGMNGRMDKRMRTDKIMKEL
jgi:hypothetical protein